MRVNELALLRADLFLQEWNLLTSLDGLIGIRLVFDFEEAQFPVDIMTDPDLVPWPSPAVMFAQALIVSGVEIESLVLSSRSAFGRQERVAALNLAQHLMQRVGVQNKFRIHALEQRPFLQKCGVGLGELAVF